MTAPVGRWRATYTPGDWVVLAGPTSVVVLQPAGAGWSSLIKTLWEQVVASASLVELAEKLAANRIDSMPSFGAFFWTEEGMRSLVRGDVKVVDLATSSVVANGEGIQTWTESDLAGVNRVRIELPAIDGGTERGSAALELPLVVGAVRAATILLDASAKAQLSSPQPMPEPQAAGVPDLPEPEVAPSAVAAAEPEAAEVEVAELEQPEEQAVEGAAEAAEPEDEGAATEAMTNPFPDEEPDLVEPDQQPVEVPVEDSTEDDPALEAEDEPVAMAEEAYAEVGQEQPLGEQPVAAAVAAPAPPVTAPPVTATPPMDPALLDSIEHGDTQLMMPATPIAATEPLPAPEEEFEDNEPTAEMSQDSMVMAVVCQYGHSSPQNATVCRVCGNPIAPQGPRLVVRPPLAVLRASNGESMQVDRAVLVGRAPSASRSTARAPRLLTVPSPGHDISRNHVEVTPDGWQVVVTDLQSTNGTVLMRPGSGDRQQLPPNEPVAVPLGSVMELGDGVSVLIDFPQ